MHKILDHGYVKFIEAWGRGAGAYDDYEVGIIEAARQSTQGSFRSWMPYWFCGNCDAVSFAAKPPPGTSCIHQWKEYKNGDEGLLKFLFSGKPQHATPFEFAGAVFEIQAPIIVFREWHRHRTQSYNEMSARYAPLPDLSYLPTEERCMVAAGRNRQANPMDGAPELTSGDAMLWLAGLENLYEHAERVYQDGLSKGVPKEVARLAVTVGRYSRMRAQANLRNWLAFMTLRADPNAQWEIRQFANAVGIELQRLFPRTWALHVAKLGV